MKSISPAGVAVILMAMVGCSSVDIRHDFDVDADFTKYRTYAWIPAPASMSGDARQALQRNTLLDKRVRSAVDTQLAAKGVTPDESNPDLLVVYHTGLQNKVDVTDWGYTYSGSYWGWAGRDIDVYSYTEGTLIIDLVEAADKQLVWRGSATGVVDPNRTPEERAKRIDDVVARIFQDYPPHKK